MTMFPTRGQLVRMVAPGEAMTELQAASARLDAAIARLDARITEVEANLANLANGPA
jgi:prefoldin subunit 5